MLLQAMTESPESLFPDVVSFNTCIKACGISNCAMQATEVGSQLVVAFVLQSSKTNYKINVYTGHILSTRACNI